MTTTDLAAGHATVAAAPSGAEAASFYWKCRWPSYRNAHPWRCHGFHRYHRHGEWNDHDGDGHHGGGGDWRKHGGGPATGAVTKHPGPDDDNHGQHQWQRDGDGPDHDGGMSPPHP